MSNNKWPDGKKFALCLTHDVDRVQKTYQYFSHFLLEKRLYHLFSFFSKKNPYWMFDEIIKIEKEFDVKSTFFFLNETKKFKLFDPSSYGKSIGYYSLNNAKIIDIIKKLDKGGWEIGLHGSYHSYNNQDLLCKEKKELELILGKNVCGIRQHFLNMKIPYSWKIQSKIGFKYDSSFGFKRKIGFKDNHYFPFKPLNNNFVEIPLNIMDSNIFTNYSKKERWDKTLQLFDLIEKKGGLITILWHQRVFNEQDFPGWSNFYKKILCECKKRDAYIGRCIDIYRSITNEQI